MCGRKEVVGGNLCDGGQGKMLSAINYFYLAFVSIFRGVDGGWGGVVDGKMGCG